MQKSPDSILFVTGEPSGDLNAALLCRSLHKKLPKARIFAVGGTHLHNAGATVLFDIVQLSVMGFIEPLVLLPRFLLLGVRLLRIIRREGITTIIMVDFPGFNLFLAAWIRRFCNDVSIIYVSPPQVWAWKPGRLEKLRERCDLLIPLLEFEHRLYTKNRLRSIYCGHLLSDRLRTRNYPQNVGEKQAAVRILLMPGSRRQEVRCLLPLMMHSCRELASQINRPIKAFLPPHPSIPAHLYRRFEVAKNNETVDCSFALLNDEPWTTSWDLALTKPGTVNLELADAGIPFVVVYRTSAVTYWIAKYVATTAHVSLVNILAQADVVPELIQSDADPVKVAKTAAAILNDGTVWHRTRDRLCSITSDLNPGQDVLVADRMAAAILDTIKKAMT